MTVIPFPDPPDFDSDAIAARAMQRALERMERANAPWPTAKGGGEIKRFTPEEERAYLRAMEP